MNEQKPVAIVGLGAIMPDAFDVASFWNNIKTGKYSIREVPADRWKIEQYYDSDPTVPDKTYSKIGGWVTGFKFNPLKWGIPIPPRVQEQMDEAQHWAIEVSRQALLDYGYPKRTLDPYRVAVILGNALGGEKHYISSLRIRAPMYIEALESVPEFKNLPPAVQKALVEGMHANVRKEIPDITEDTMPGELSNIIAGRVANVFNFQGPNFTTDAACASSLAALQAAVEGLNNFHFDAVITGGVDRMMGVEAFVKFSKIGALSPDGSRPYADGANGFVMGEGAAAFLLKRLEDAERDGDRIYAVVRGIGSSSDGKGKGITAPNPSGQQHALERAWKNSGLSPATVGLIEGHGTSTPVGDLVEVNSLNTLFSPFNLPAGKIALGSVKSNIGHLKSAAGAAGLLKTTLSLYEKVLPPSVNFERPNPNIDFPHLPFYVNTTLRSWEVKKDEVRRAGISSFGFGGTNFHGVFDEYIPGMLTMEKKVYPSVEMQRAEALIPAPALNPEPALDLVGSAAAAPRVENAVVGPKPYRGLLFLSADGVEELKIKLAAALEAAKQGSLPPSLIPSAEAVARAERIAIDYSDAEELAKRCERALKGFETDGTTNPWPALVAHGVFHGSGKPGKVAFLFPGQGSQYANMLKDLCEVEPVVADTFKEADRVMAPILGRPLTSYIYVNGDEAAIAEAEKALRNTEITQPAMLTANVALLRLMNKFGFQPDMVIGHSLGEYAALVAAGVLSFAEALEVVSARGREMSKVSWADNGCMAAVSAPISEVERIIQSVDGYVVIANINSPLQSVIGGDTTAVDAAMEAFKAAGFQGTKIPVSHAFHTRIVAPASVPLREVIARMDVKPPKLTVVANVTGKVYPNTKEEILDTLASQVASPVQFIKGMQTLYNLGARVYAEIGPKRVLNALATDNLKGKNDVAILATNHPREGAVVSFNKALCGLFAAGIATQTAPVPTAIPAAREPAVSTHVKVVEREASRDGRLPLTGSVVISGAGLGLPGRGGHVFSDENIASILRGEVRIEALPEETRKGMLDKRVVRLIKSEAGATMELIDQVDQTVKLGGQRGEFNLTDEFGVPADRVEATDISTQLAIAAGIEALRDAGIPLVMAYRQTSKGTLLPDRWKLPESLADETGVIFGSAFPGLDEMAEETGRFYEYQGIENQVKELRGVLALVPAGQTDLRRMLERRISELEARLTEIDYHFDRRYIFRILSMGHSQFAEYIGARGPNTHVNAACATTTHAVSIAEDWIRAGRARRVVVIAGDDVTSGPLADWVPTGLMASGAATIEGNPRMAILPFDRRRNGLIMGMGAAALVVESEDAVRERGMRGICEVIATQIANSAFHGTRLDVQHVGDVMERLLDQAEGRFGIRREAIAGNLVFVSHETYTPARGGSASAEIKALRRSFGDQANRVVIANTKGYTGHTMGVGVEDVVAVKALETGIVPPIANIQDGFEPDPDLGDLNLSKGGNYGVNFALRLGAGFGSQIAMSLLRKIPGESSRVDRPAYRDWLDKISGYAEAELEVERRTLRIRHDGPPAHAPAKSGWQFGQGPMMWAAEALPAVEESAVAAPAVKPIPAVAAPVPAQAAAAAAPAVEQAEIKQFVLGLVSEKTGYPPEMLDLELDLEADLGVDTVKQAELFASVRAHYNIPRREDLRLADYNTLAKVIGFVNDALGSAAVSAPEASPQPAAVVEEKAPVLQESAGPVQPPASAPAPAGEAEIKALVLQLVSEKTGYPPEMLDLGLDLEADLGIDTVKQAELFASVRTHFNIPRREDLRLADYNTLAKVIGFVSDSLLGVGAIEAPAAQPAAQPAAVQPPTAAVEAPAAAHADSDEVKNLVLKLVSEKTGYPPEMLDLELDLEADLGIDTVKQAELFASVRSHYGIPRREDLRLADYNTLAKVIGFVTDSLAAMAQAAEKPIESGVQASSVQPEDEETSKTALEAESQERQAIARKTPVPVLRPRLDLCRPSGVNLDETSRVVVVADQGKVGDSLARKLRVKNVQILSLNPIMANAAGKIAEFAGQGPIQGVYFLPALDEEPSLSALDYPKWQESIELRAHLLYRVLRAIPGEPFLVSATRMGGLHGYSAGGASAPMGGVVSGFTKSMARERPGSLHKVVDFERGAPAASIATRLLGETLSDPAIVEVGWKDDLRFGFTLVEQPVETAGDLPQGSVFIVSGGSAGIIAPVVMDLARKTRGKFYLLSRTPLPGAQDADVIAIRADREAFKKTLVRRLQEKGEKATPAVIEGKLALLDRAASTLEAIELIQKTEAQVEYKICDVTDAAAVLRTVEEIARVESRVDVFIHAAGVERSRKLESKPEDEFRQTLSVKVDGFFHLFKALETCQRLPGKILFFSSVAARFGNSGQSDYAAANDLLCKLASAIPQEYPGVRATAIDWGAWSEVGMASRGYIPELMKRAGIEMIKPAAAAPLVYAELSAASSLSEVVLAGSLGNFVQPKEANGGLDLEKANQALRKGKPIHIMLTEVTGYNLNDGVILEAELDPNNEPFLKDHAVNGIPVLPGVMGIEGLSTAARHVSSVLASEKGAFQVSHIENVQFLAAFKFYRNKPRRVTWKANVFREGDRLAASVSLESTLTRYGRDPEKMLHFTGKVFLVPGDTQKLEPVTSQAPHWNGSSTLTADEIYKLYFHGPAFQVLEGVQHDGKHVFGKLQSHLPPTTSTAFDLTIAPLLVELCLQTAGVWEIGKTGVIALPRSIGEIRFYKTGLQGETVFAEVVPWDGEDGRLHFDARVVDTDGAVYMELKNYSTEPLPYSVEKNQLIPLRTWLDLTQVPHE